jgi:glutathione S-transferase
MIALHEKGIAFNAVEAAVRNERGEWAIPREVEKKPAWFTALNPEGKVPTILYKEDAITHVLPESLVLLEFLEDWAPPSAPSLLPPHPATRARTRLAARRVDDAFVPPFYRLLRGGQTPEAARADKAALLAAIDWLEEHADLQGPFYCGANFSIADAAAIPFFLRLFELKARTGFELPARCAKLIRWYENCVARESVVATLITPDDGDDYENALAKFFSHYLGPRPVGAKAA